MHTKPQGEGIIAMANMIEQYVASYPEAEVVLMGYSQARRSEPRKIIKTFNTAIQRVAHPTLLAWVSTKVLAFGIE